MDNGIYTIKSGYWFATHLPNQDLIESPLRNTEIKSQVRKTKTAPKIKHLMWKMISNGLPTGEMLAKRRISQQVTCPTCIQTETLHHLFFDCAYAQKIWRASNIPLTIIVDTTVSFEEKIKVLIN